MRRARTTAVLCAVLALLLCAAVTHAEEHGESAGGHAGAHGGGHSKEINWWKADVVAPPVGWLIVDFAILFGALYFILRKPLGAYLTNRRATMKDQIDEAGKVKAEIEAKHRDVLARLAAVDQTVKDITASFASRGEDEKRRLIEAAEHLRQAIELSAKETIEREVTAAKGRIRAEVTRSAGAIAEELLKKHLKPDDNDRFVREFVERLSTIKPDELR